MSKSHILALIEALRVAGQAEIGAPRYLDQHNAQVDAAAKALVAEIEKQPCEKFPLKNPQEILHIPEVP